MTQASQLRGTNTCTNSGALTAAGSETVYDTTIAINFSVEGEALTKATVTDGATPVVDGNGDAFPALAVTNSDGSLSGKGACVVWGLTAAGVVTCFQGTIVELNDISTDFTFSPEFPTVPDTVTPFAFQILKQQSDGSTADTATFGTSDWDATRFTNTITNVMTLPRRPQEI